MILDSSVFPLSGGTTNIAGFEWSEKTADFTAVANKAYYCDTALGDILMTLPTAPANGSQVAFFLIGSNRLLITTGANIKSTPLLTDYGRGVTENYLVVILTYVNSTIGWDWNSRYDSFIPSIYIGDGDPLFSNTLLILKGDGTNNSTSIVDSSGTPKTITRFGDVKISTAQSKYGGSSIYFDGTGDYLRAPSLMTTNMNFTIESWVYPLATFSGGFVDTASGQSGTFRHFGGNIETPGANATALNITSNTWSHLAICFNSATSLLTIYVNGVLHNSRTFNRSTFDSTNFDIGTVNSGGSANYNGYFDSYRVSDIVRYTTTFNPDTDTYLQ